MQSRKILESLEKQEAIYREFVAAGNYSLWPSPDPRATAGKAIDALRADSEALRRALSDFEAAVLADNWNVTMARKTRLAEVLISQAEAAKAVPKPKQ